MVRGVGLEPDPRGLDRDDPKVMRNYRRRLKNFKRAEKFQNLINRLKGKTVKRGTPRASRIAERIKKLGMLKERAYQKSRLKRFRDKDSGRRNEPSDTKVITKRPKPRRPERDSRIDDSGMGPKRRRPMPKPISRRFAPGERRKLPKDMPKPISRRRVGDERRPMPKPISRRRVPRRG